MDCQLNYNDDILPDIPYTPAHLPNNITPPSQSQIPLNVTTRLTTWGPVFEPLVNTLNWTIRTFAMRWDILNTLIKKSLDVKLVKEKDGTQFNSN